MRRLNSHTGAAGSRSALLTQLSGFVESRLGLHFPAERLGDLERAVASAAGEFGFAAIDPCIEWLLASSLSHSQLETLASHLTVGETYFFRDRRVFEILETQVLPAIIASRRGRHQHLRLWSAACSSGEEPYSLAILLSRIIPDLADWKISILATDISPSSLKKASEGLYGEWSFRETPHWVKQGSFTKRAKKYEIAPRIKRMVTFSCLNLAEDPYPAIINATNAMDIIFCRNVLIYFSQSCADAVVGNLSRCLVDGGWLVVSPVEVPGATMPPLLHPVHFPGAVLYRRGEIAADTAPWPAIPPAPAGVRPKPPLAGNRKTPATTRVARPEKKPQDKVPAQAPDAAPAGRTPQQARRLADQGRLAEALAVCDAAIAAAKLDPGLHYLRATILQELGMTAEAMAALQRALYIDQEFGIAHFALGHLLHGQGRRKEAGKHLAKARSLLERLGHDEVVPEAEGLSAGRLIELIQALQRLDERG